MSSVLTWKKKESVVPQKLTLAAKRHLCCDKMRATSKMISRAWMVALPELYTAWFQGVPDNLREMTTDTDRSSSAKVCLDLMPGDHVKWTTCNEWEEIMRILYVGISLQLKFGHFHSATGYCIKDVTRATIPTICYCTVLLQSTSESSYTRKLLQKELF